VRTATYIPQSYDDLYPGIRTFTEVLAAQSGGRLVCDMFDSGTLLGAEQLLPGLLLGVADVMFQTSSYVSSSYPILGAMELPFGTEDFARQRRAIDPEGPLFALVNGELATQGVRLLGGMPCTFEYLWTVGRPIRTPEDARGLRIRVAGEIEGETVKALGGAPVFMGSSEVFEALERGTIDGLMSYVGTVVSRDLQEIVRYGTRAHFGAYTVDAYCRAEWYAAQPPELRAALDAAGRALYRDGTEVMAGVHERDYLPAVTAAGVELVEPDAAELAAFRAAVAPVYGRWEHLVGDPAVAARALQMIEAA
jgi:TRAP-type C4-dicarboxylate transport system substrate-binding protein